MVMAVFSSDDEPAASRPDYWRHVVAHVVADALGGADLRPPSDDRAAHQLDVGEAGSVRITRSTVLGPGPAALCEATRTARHIRGSADDLGRVDIVAAGQMVIEQDGREAELKPGDFAFVDLARPGRWATAADRWYAVTFPRTLLPLRRDDTAHLTGRRILGHRGAGALVSSFAHQLTGHLGDMRSTDRVRLGTALLDLIGMALPAQVDPARLG